MDLPRGYAYQDHCQHLGFCFSFIRSFILVRLLVIESLLTVLRFRYGICIGYDLLLLCSEYSMKLVTERHFGHLITKSAHSTDFKALYPHPEGSIELSKKQMEALKPGRVVGQEIVNSWLR